ncbi:MAG: FliM/FliN family flagellar motor C-terminal domain-containing protein [Candidatus Korobacteraceae bacterium]
MSAANQNAPLSLPGDSAAPSEPRSADRDPAEVLPWLPCTASLEIPLSHFTIRDLSQLGAGSIVTTAYRHLSDIPLWVNGQLIGWAEFEVIDDRLAVRITEMA